MLPRATLTPIDRREPVRCPWSRRCRAGNGSASSAAQAMRVMRLIGERVDQRPALVVGGGDAGQAHGAAVRGIRHRPDSPVCGPETSSKISTVAGLRACCLRPQSVASVAPGGRTAVGVAPGVEVDLVLLGEQSDGICHAGEDRLRGRCELLRRKVRRTSARTRASRAGARRTCVPAGRRCCPFWRAVSADASSRVAALADLCSRPAAHGGAARCGCARCRCRPRC